MIWYIIEHPTRGVFTELDFDVITGEPTPHFSPTAPRNDERVEKFFNAAEVSRVIGKLSDKLQHECYVVRAEKEYGEPYARYTLVPPSGSESV